MHDYLSIKGNLTVNEREALRRLAARVVFSSTILSTNIGSGDALTSLRVGNQFARIIGTDQLGSGQLGFTIEAEYIKSDIQTAFREWKEGALSLALVYNHKTFADVAEASKFSTYVYDGGYLIFHGCYDTDPKSKPRTPDRIAPYINDAVNEWLVNTDSIWEELDSVDSMRIFQKRIDELAPDESNKMPVVSILLPTFNRPEILKETIARLKQNLIYDGVIEYLVGNDGEELEDLGEGVVVLEGPKSGLGANLNRLIHSARGYYLLQMDDDHWLTQPLDLNTHVLYLRKNPLAGWIRLMGIGSHDLTARLKGNYWWVDWKSEELYITSNRPHLKHKRFHSLYGYYQERRKLGETEEAFCHDCKTMSKRLSRTIDVLVPLNILTESMWDHVGDSWQKQGY